MRAGRIILSGWGRGLGCGAAPAIVLRRMTDLGGWTIEVRTPNGQQHACRDCRTCGSASEYVASTSERGNMYPSTLSRRLSDPKLALSPKPNCSAEVVRERSRLGAMGCRGGRGGAGGAFLVRSRSVPIPRTYRQCSSTAERSVLIYHVKEEATALAILDLLQLCP